MNFARSPRSVRFRCGPLMPEALRVTLRFIQLSYSFNEACMKFDPGWDDVIVASAMVYDMIVGMDGQVLI